MQAREAEGAQQEKAADALLEFYLSVSDEKMARVTLRRLLEEEAAPVIEHTLRRKTAGEAEAEDVSSAARSHLLEQLVALRRGERERPIRNFRAYAARVAYSAWAEDLRRKKPQRSMLFNRLQYLLENRTAQTNFALWEADGRKWCGWAKWRGGECLTTPKLQWLLTDPIAVGREIAGNRSGLTSDLSEVVGQLFDWLETPIELRALLDAIAELWQISDRNATLESVATMAAAQVSPAEELAWKEYLRWLWSALEQLSSQQCGAFILHAEVLGDFEAFGFCSIRTLAPRLGFAPEKLAALWRELPLNDLRIAAELSCSRQQVINLRRVARDKLGKAWREFSR